MFEVKTIGKKEVHLDDILSKFSLFGRYHSGFIGLIVLLYICDSLSCTNYIFVVENVKYRCKDERFANNTCTSLSNSTEVCTEWVYDNPVSFVAEFELACQDWKRTLVGTVHNFGYGIGLLIIGPLSDRWGRKKLIIITGIFATVLGVSRSFAPNYWFYIVFEFLVAALGDVYSPSFILLMEMVSHDKRVVSSMLCSFGTSISAIIFAVFSWLIPYWRNLLRVVYGPAIIVILYIFLLDESPRWLLNKGKKDEAVAVLQKAAKRNNIEIEKDLLDNICYEENKGVKFLELIQCTFSSSILLKRFLICITWWIAGLFIIYGITINCDLLPGNKYINFGLISVVDISARMFTTFIIMRFRRRNPLIFSFLSAAVFLVILPFIPQNLPWLSILLFMAGRMMSTVFIMTTYIFTSEIFPTYTRNSMHALCSALGRVGSVTAPMTPLLEQYWHGLPFITFALVALTTGLVTFAAPDTADESLPDTVRQAEAFGKKEIQKTDKNMSSSMKTHEKCTTQL